jgi:sRNA-binding protein
VGEKPGHEQQRNKSESYHRRTGGGVPSRFYASAGLVRPIKLGIRNDLYAQSAISRRRITAALASTEGAVRIDLAGEPAGKVTATEARHARDGLAAHDEAAVNDTKVANLPRGSQAPQGAGTGRSSPPEAASKGSSTGKRTPATDNPGQKRLSLADLKRAAAARKAKFNSKP